MILLRADHSIGEQRPQTRDQLREDLGAPRQPSPGPISGVCIARLQETPHISYTCQQAMLLLGKEFSYPFRLFLLLLLVGRWSNVAS